VRDFGRQVRALFNSPKGAYRGYEVRAVFSLARGVRGLPSLRRARYLRLASAGCGARSAKASWVVIAEFPNARAVTVAQEVYWLAPTANGWQVWWTWNPQPGWDKTGGFPGH
jgi:hypothetical protein